MFRPKAILVLRKTLCEIYYIFSLPHLKAVYSYQTYVNTVLAEENVFSPYKKMP